MAYTVSQLNNIIKEYIDINPSLRRVQVIGEISNLKKHYTGHWYLTLKDENSRINAMDFASYASRIKIKVNNVISLQQSFNYNIFEIRSFLLSLFSFPLALRFLSIVECSFYSGMFF